MKHLLFKTLIMLVASSITLTAFATTDAEVVAKQRAEEAAQGATGIEASAAWKKLEELKQNAVTQWSGKAQGLAFFKTAQGGPDLGQGPQLGSKSWTIFDADMSFVLVDDADGNSHLYYLSAISPTYDKQITEDGKGLCQNSRPREVVVKWNAATQSYGLNVQLTKFVGPAADLPANVLETLPDAQKAQLPYVLYSVPLAQVVQTGNDLSFYSFLTMPKQYEKMIDNSVGKVGAHKNYVMQVKYDMKEKTSSRSKRLAAAVAACVQDQPWNKFKFMSDAEAKAAAAAAAANGN